MTAYAALLRAVNVGGRKLAMADLRAVAAELGLRDPATLLQSGNLVFSTAKREQAALAEALASAIATRAGFAPAVMLRSRDAWDALIGQNPFAVEAAADPAHLVAVVLATPVTDDAAAEGALRAAVRARERVAVRGGTAYVFYPDGIGESKLTAAAIDRALGVAGTGRNWNTVLKLRALLAER